MGNSDINDLIWNSPFVEDAALCSSVGGLLT